MTVPERLSALRKCMEEKNIDVYVVPLISIKVNMLGNISKRESSLQGSQDQQEQL